MKLYLIDPEAKTIEPWEYNGDYKTLYSGLGCDLFDVARFNETDGVFVDDEGLFKNPQFFFMITGYPQPLAGKGIVHAVDDEGETVEPSVDLEWLRKNVTWVSVGDFLGIPTIIFE